MAIMDRFLHLSHQIIILQLRQADALLNIRLQGIFREVLGLFHTSSAWKVLVLHFIITAAGSDSAFYSNRAHMNQFVSFLKMRKTRHRVQASDRPLAKPWILECLVSAV